MQNEQTTSTETASVETVASVVPAIVETAPAAKPNRAAKRAATSNGKAAAKRVAAKQAAKPQSAAKPAKPTQAEREAAQRDQNDARRLARDVAAQAVSAFYAGSSKPFKAASDTFAPLNSNNQKPGASGIGTDRQAGLLLALLTYGSGNLQPNGHFTRGGFRVPAKLINASAKPGETILAQPESGCAGNALGLTLHYVSGPLSGAGQREAVYRVDYVKALQLISHTFGDKTAKAAAKLVPAKQAA